uniref:Uncharacterized protein n=1 Tax=Magallana gigas TaxID=29159 RepID=A0A8W8K3L6_MAGGI
MKNDLPILAAPSPGGIETSNSVTVSFTAFLKLQSRPFASTPENFDQLRNNSYGNGYKLITGSLPTLNLPKKSIETPCAPARPDPTSRPTPIVPERVVYYSLAEVRKDFEKNHNGDWVKVRDDALVLGKYNQSAGTMEKLVTITDDLEVTVRFGEVVVQGFENSVEKMRVNKFLEAVDKITKCAGIKDSPDVTIKSSQGYRFFSTHVINGKPSNKRKCFSQYASS